MPKKPFGDSYHSTRPDEVKYGHCAVEECEAQFDDHYWGKVKAGDEGWFFQKDGTNWCPLHIPDWVEAWRRNKALRAKQARGKI